MIQSFVRGKDQDNASAQKAETSALCICLFAMAFFVFKAE